MIQKKYLCKDIKTAEEAVRSINRIIDDTPHKSALVTIYEKGFAPGNIRSLIGMLKESGHLDVQIAGISLTIVAELLPEGTGLLLNLILTDEADIEVVSVPCFPQEEIGAAGILKSRLDDHKNVRAVELFGI